MTVAVPSREEGAVVPSPLTAAEAAALGADDVLDRLGSRTPGLPEGEAARRLRVVGPNAVRSHWVHALSVLASQLRSPLLMLLAVTALASAFLGQASDAVIIGVILAASVSLGFVNEYKAAKTAEALHSSVRHSCVARRDGHPDRGRQALVLPLLPGPGHARATAPDPGPPCAPPRRPLHRPHSPAGPPAQPVEGNGVNASAV
jgi:magnesium-transporting ATPase (P-type)